MKRRITLAILGTVAAALLIAGVGTLLLARVGARQTAEDELRAQAESTANIVAFGQNRLGQLSTADIEALRLSICTNPDGSSQATTTTRPNQSVAATDRLRLSLCEPDTDVAIANAKADICDNSSRRADAILSEQTKHIRDAFCADPNEQTLDAVRVAYCNAQQVPVETMTGAKRRAELIRQNICRSITVRAQTQDQLETALSKESIDMVVFGPENELVQGELPGALTPADLRPQRLRDGDVVSGPIGNGAYAAAPVDPDDPNMSVIVIARPSDPVRGLVQWFLIAAGITLAIGVVVAASLSRALTRPLREAQRVTADIAAGDLAARLPETSYHAGDPKDELEELAHSINTMAEALERSKGLERQFLLSVSHDLRTPLTSIRGYAEAIADGAAPDPQRAATVILAESRRLERLVKDLLDLAKIDARRFTFHVDEVELNDVAGDSVDGFRREVEAAGLTLHLERSAAPVVAFADPDRLQQVIANLVENALKFASTTIEVRVSQDPARPDEARIEVIDDGPGIAPADLPHVFERLYVATAVPQRKEAGSGLGLAIVREVTEAMGGRVEACDNGPGVPGARLVVTLSTVRPPD